MTNTVMKTWPVSDTFKKQVRKLKKSIKQRGYKLQALEYYDEHDAVFFVVTHDGKLRSVVLYCGEDFLLEEEVFKPAELSIVEGLEGKT